MSKINVKKSYIMPIVENKVFYVPVEKINPLDKQKAKKWYAAVRHSGRATIDTLKNIISGRSSLSRGDVASVIDNLIDVIVMQLRNGRIVELGDLGTLHISVRSKGADKKTDLTSANISRAYIRYRPGEILKESLSSLSFMRLGDAASAEAPSPGTSENTDTTQGGGTPTDNKPGGGL